METVNPNQKMETARSKIMGAVIQDILPWIEANLSDESIRVRSVTERSGYGHWHFQRVFRKQTGVNLATYIRIRRIVRAAYSVAFTEKEIIDIAIENGFSSQQNFSRSFNCHFRVAPTTFRKKCKGREVIFKMMTSDIQYAYDWIFFDAAHHVI
ncbi:helix-turn-helix domain-containing protein (plasmid) [Enterobacter ludwigii]